MKFIKYLLLIPMFFGAIIRGDLFKRPHLISLLMWLFYIWLIVIDIILALWD